MNKLNQIALDVGDFCGIGPLGLCDTDRGTAPSVFNSVLSIVVGIISIIGGIWFIFVLVTGAVSLITSGGDKAAVESARKRIATGAIGLVVLIASIFIIDIFGRILGINFLNPAAFISSLTF